MELDVSFSLIFVVFPLSCLSTILKEIYIFVLNHRLQLHASM